ncbi:MULTISPECIES: diglucosylglycerate octanoyltransferase [Prauserella salsuginis group]|uniref:Diglucosylglycerate octanoyltransferase n=1 Tax=Prauserella salsuginis TaxID=387889 RepID=A0ABW6G5E8_9PSEU|nr:MULTISPECIES: diglucosylglycerate octanoyltransferase [Prauserella salsuginis group]MCR3718974.1 GDSL-like Lipase/Acylhydrolase family [Prauserella flava]MCR3733544.1 GDSL-like Lipase/Acylhydrolase family [Prauserella salsuginis]
MTEQAPVTAPRILVLGDSLTFHGPDSGHPADEPRLWPNVCARHLGGEAVLFAGFGWTARDAWWALIGDPQLWAELHRADVVVLAVGSMDTLPSPLPTYLRTGLRYLRPDGLRRFARGAYRRAQPALARLTRGRPAVLPARLTVRYLDTAVGALRVLRPELPIVGWLPSVHRSADYGRVHSERAATAARLTAWSEHADVPMLDVAAVVGAHVLGGHGNPDGMHWGWDGHAAVGRAMADRISAVRPGVAAAPVPGRDAHGT